MTTRVRKHPPAPRPSNPTPFRLSPLAALIAGMAIAGSAPLHAADTRSVAELQAEIARLQQELAAKTAAEGGTAAAPAAAPAASSPAADGSPQALDTVVVRSRHRLERLQDVPVSVAVVTGAELEREGASDLDAIAKRVGNFSWNPGNARTSSLSIRGLGKQSQTDAMDPSVGINVDNVAYSYNPLSSFDLFDVDSVEVLRGPQGTLFGKNANLGVLKITNKRPSFNPEADYSLTFGEEQRFIARGAVGGGVVDGLLAWRGAFQFDRGQGYVKNVEKGYLESTFGNHDRAAGRVQFLLTPGPDFDARLSIEMAPTTGEAFNGKTVYTPTPTRYADGSVNTLSSDASTRLARRWFRQLSSYDYQRDYLYGGNTVNLDHQTPTYTDTKGISAELNWRVAGHTLTSITAYKDFRFQVRNDEGTPFDITKRGGGHVDKFEQISQEFRLTSELGGFVDYQTGVLLLKSSNRYDSNAGFGSDAGAWFASNSQYNTLDANSNGRYLLENSLNELQVSPLQKIETQSAAIFGQANWHLTEPLTLTTGLRFTHEDRDNRTSRLIINEGYGAELNPVAVNGVQLGGFSSNNTTGELSGTNSTAQLNVADFVANKYFGTAITATPGQAYASLTAAQKRQVAAAKAIRRTNIGVLWAETKAKGFRETQPTLLLSPSYKVNENLTTYFSAQYGEKAGIAQITNGYSNPVKPEKTTSFELGFKSTLLDRTLVLNANIFRTNIRDYQQAVQVYDEYTTNLNNDGTTYYTSATGNVPKVRVNGVEIDATYSGIRYTTLRFSGAYNDAVYKSFPNAGKAAEVNNIAAPYVDLSGKNLPGAAKYTFSVGAEYRRPVLGDKEFHTSFNTYYTSKFNSDNTLSSYGWIDAHSTTDFSIGLGRRDKSYDVTLLVKNLFDDDTPLAKTWNTYVPAPPRWVGIVFSGKL
ncbi:TonB-dependent receptor [Azoarcus olearius]|uniref:TonB-dependent receptor n=1 Tax=Azoarcus sp. (strain BH72) TaxID=418699 RepID=A1K809_AZOSB|nr:TonB-dependent receptor [Azoarcus olearius]CAL94964.1 putative TonB-dependent receptor [Azoarcus olearius]